MSAVPGHTLWGAVLLAFGLSGCGDGMQPSASPPPDRLVVDRGDLSREVLLTGELVAEEAAVLAGPSVGIWPLQVRWVADGGTPVQAEDPVVVTSGLAAGEKIALRPPRGRKVEASRSGLWKPPAG